ncbi:MAG: precorrin-4 C(11)-methyltransferase [Azospirillaceae bacterium]
MTVHFIGAGPGAADLITVRGRDLIARCPLCLYAGSLVSEAVVAAAPESARVVDTASMTLDEIVEAMRAAHEAGQDVARVHSGDPSIYGAIGEQMRRLDALGIPFEIVPGVPAFAAAAASLKRELTLPGIAQSVVVTRTARSASAMPPGEELETFARSGTTLAIHLAIRDIRRIVEVLTPYYGADCPVVVAYRVSWPDEAMLRGTLADIAAKVREARITRTALILVGPVLGGDAFEDSRLYHADHRHIFRTGKAAATGSDG